MGSTKGSKVRALKAFLLDARLLENNDIWVWSKALFGSTEMARFISTSVDE